MLDEIQTLRDMYREYSNAELADNEHYQRTIENLWLLIDTTEAWNDTTYCEECGAPLTHDWTYHA